MDYYLSSAIMENIFFIKIKSWLYSLKPYWLYSSPKQWCVQESETETEM